MFACHACFCLKQLTDMRLAHIVVFVTVKIAPGVDEFQVAGIQTNRHRNWTDRIKRQRVEFSVWFLACGDVAQGMRVIVDGFDFFNCGGELRIRSCLSRHVGNSKDKGKQENKRDELFHKDFSRSIRIGLVTTGVRLVRRHSSTLNLF